VSTRRTNMRFTTVVAIEGPLCVSASPSEDLLRGVPVERAGSILKERLFGLTGNEGNHGEDFKECYYYLDSTPTHMKFLYKYAQLVRENGARGRGERKFELADTATLTTLTAAPRRTRR
jgi:hypothetical protein